ncbi:MAG TPA: pilus assembly protein N-terminal domain-containing protein [Terracidiphilus sp.]|nr:pilus assembly protein N-terminal domain-containing protein [Terracidiphilus sp.]
MRARIRAAFFYAIAFAIVSGSGPVLWAQDAGQAPATNPDQAPASGQEKPPTANKDQNEPPAPPPPPSRPVAAPTQDSTNDLTVSVGKSVVLDMAKPVTQIAVGSAEIAEAVAVSPTQVLINGKKVGETSVIVWDVSGGRQFFNLTVRESMLAINDALDAVRRQLRIELPGQHLRVSEESGSVFLRGTVNDLNSSDRAVQIASSAGKVVNLLNVVVPNSEPQILLKVRFASIDRNKSNALGLNIFSTGFGNTIGTATTGQFSPPTVTVPSGSDSATATLSDQLNLFAFYPGLNLGATLKALETKGLAEVLAEPNLLAEDGKQASFLAGGEYPYPMVQGSSGGVGGAVTIQFKQYGVRLAFIPTVTPRGTIRLQVAPEVSALDFSNAVTISGFVVPAITVRRVETEVELQDGQSFAIGGLLDNRETETLQKIPFLGDIPVLGKFFQSMQRNRTNTELIVLVTPEIVSPIPAGAPLPQLKYPRTFLPPNSGIPMYTPDEKTPANTLPPPPATIPVEQLKQFNEKKEEKLNTGSGSGTSMMGGSGGSSTGP